MISNALIFCLWFLFSPTPLVHVDENTNHRQKLSNERWEREPSVCAEKERKTPPQLMIFYFLWANKTNPYMFVGHFAVGLGAKSLKPSVSLGTYFLAVQFVDLLWPTLLLFNIEEVMIDPGNTAMTPLDFVHYPYTHSLVMSMVWSAAGFGLVYLFKKDSSAALLVAACVASHWLLDFFTHRPDLPLTLSESTKVGLGLWNYKTATILIETALFVTGTWLYSKSTKPLDKIGTYGFWGLIAFLAVISISNAAGPPPPNVGAIAWAGHLQWLIVIWAYWVDRHRQPSRASV